ncbi:MAG TPA: tyrosine-type recombinase/integrase [Solirubrobacteraceae bacterium]
MAWIETRGKAKNKVWRVRWYDAAGKQRSQTFHDYPTAKAFEVEVESRQQRGQVAAVDAGRITLDEFVVETWIPTYAATKALNTQLDYEARYKHVAPLGAYSLRDLTPEVIRRWQAHLETRRITAHMRHKALGLLGNILQRAVEGEHIPTNPARLVTPPKLPRPKEVVPFSPAEIEAIRTVALAPAPIEVRASDPGTRPRRAYSAPAPGTAYTRHRDATLISVMAYAGLRPHEAWILTWGDVRERTLLVYSPKTDSTRTVRLLAPLADDLRRFRMASGRPDEAALIFPGPNGREWDKTTYDNWRSRTFNRLLRAASLRRARPYDLRHSFASLLIYEGRTVIYVARQLGHSPTLTLSTYGHVIDELEDEGPRQTAVDAISLARDGDTAERPGQNVSSG